MNEKAFWRGFYKAAADAPWKNNGGPTMMQSTPPQYAQIQQLMRSMPMQQQQQFERQLAGKFGMSGQSFQMNPSAHL